ncbi:MAG TPA: twin-arginine translocase TatA/TatE family subunit [Pyrinomonadaceae bacterium]|jgi:sec-independent protein translocase protein TatB|nr:twin-arginine translocase TatA/TatE family subunit [Pyrinomonadaceae bacterium]
MMLGFILEGLGTTELLVIVVVALILFGPRKLPQLSRSLGKSLGEFKRASEDFKRTWEKEVALEERQKEARIEQAMLPEDNSIIGDTVERRRAVNARAAAEAATTTATASGGAASGASDAVAVPQAAESSAQSSVPPFDLTATSEASTTSSEPMRKRDWL